MRYIYQHRDWPKFRWNSAEIASDLEAASFATGKFSGRLAAIGFAVQSEAVCETLSAEILNSAEIEGERLNRDDVRSSVAKRMEVVLSDAKRATSRATEARADMMIDATRNWDAPMTAERLFAWHAALFPTGYSELSRIAVGRFRNDVEGPMRVVSRHGTMERVHFVAPDAETLPGEIKRLMAFVNSDDGETPWLVRAAVAHLWFLTLHPFDDGNGRLARALTEYLLAKGERSAMRFYSLSAEIQAGKDAYYDAIKRAQRGTLDVTRWIRWFLGCHRRAIGTAEVRLGSILAKAEFWNAHASDELTANQRAMLNRLFDGFKGNLTSSKWAKICKVSQDTASREINALVAKGILRREGQGRSTHYALREECCRCGNVANANCQ